MGRDSNNSIWRREDVKITESGRYVRLIAPCGESRRVTPATARKIAAELLRVADLIEESSSPALEKIDSDPHQDHTPDDLGIK